MLLSSIFLLAGSACAAAWSTLTVPHTNGADDSPGLLAVLENYTANSTILFEKDVTYNIFSPIKFPTLTNVEVSIQGNLTYPTNVSAIQGAVASSNYPGSWITFSGGTNVTLRGSQDDEWGWIDGHGQQWWDAMNQDNRPHGIAFSKISGGVIRDVKIWKPVAWNFATSGSSDLHVFNNTILAISDNSAFPFNTDGFSAGGTNLLFESNYIVNGDDCLTVGSGAKNIIFRNTHCENGHGLSIGSLGKDGAVADVENVLIENNFMKNSLYGARFKSWTGGNGLARNITWRNIAFEQVRFPIYVTQNYWDQGLGPAPNTSSTNNTHIEDFLFQNFVGTIDDRANYTEGSCISDPCWYAVANATGKEVIIFDLYPNTATSIVAKDIFAKTETGAPVAVMCNPDTVTNDVGFVCQDGEFMRTAAG
ncbi:pectin lyase-like protein [Fomitiporia mediterranea MF3/22]|uniref:pectin lyase-like protein n=1 Tax=Fomitiporia mediterranea (strain MF3/22) TaxID=694068 RepID=UPI0004409123|nr:pectin lyase-like protein [Fomitiporia mediterranea MF3/22]EJD04200.1 pectin lyase-like protein [Fomitiporia mediterranea MF3/22]